MYSANAMPDDIQELQDLDIDLVSGVADPANETDGWLVVRAGSKEALADSISEESQMADENDDTSTDEGTGDDGGSDEGGGDDNGSDGDTDGDEGDGDKDDVNRSDPWADDADGGAKALRDRYDKLERQRKDDVKRANKLEAENKALADEIAEIRRSQQESELRLEVERATKEVSEMGDIDGDPAKWGRHLVLLRMDPLYKETAAAFEELLRSNATLSETVTNSEVGTSEGDDGDDAMSVLRSARDRDDDDRSDSQVIRDKFGSMSRAEKQEFINDYYGDRAVGR